MGVHQESTEQVSLAPGTSQATELVRTLGLRTIAFLDGSLRVESTNDRIILITLKNIGLNIAMLPNEILHALHAGVIEELRAWEQCAINLIREYKVNNEEMFIEKT